MQSVRFQGYEAAGAMELMCFFLLGILTGWFLRIIICWWDVNDTLIDLWDKILEESLAGHIHTDDIKKIIEEMTK